MTLVFSLKHAQSLITFFFNIFNTCLCFTSGSTKKLLNYVSKEYGIQVDEISITFPVNSAKEVNYIHSLHNRDIIVSFVLLLIIPISYFSISYYFIG